MNSLLKQIKTFLSIFQFGWLRRFVPKDVKTISAYEIIAYLLFFILVLWIYNVIQEVPVHNDTVTIKRIHKGEKDSLAYAFNVEYIIPMTFVYGSSERTGVFSAKRDVIKDSLSFNAPIISDDDSLMAIYRSFVPNYLDDIRDRSIFHIKSSQYHTVFGQAVSFSNRTWSIKEGFKNFIGQIIRINGNLSNEMIGPFDDVIVGMDISDKDELFNVGPLSRPRWFNNFDISQSYYDIKFDTNLDSGRISMDFVGVTEFSKIAPEPDTITMSSIIYTNKDKIKVLKDNGLKFHAKHIELQNFQNSRVFFITAVMSALFAIFVTYVVLSVVKLSSRKKTNKQDKQKEN